MLPAQGQGLPLHQLCALASGPVRCSIPWNAAWNGDREEKQMKEKQGRVQGRSHTSHEKAEARVASGPALPHVFRGFTYTFLWSSFQIQPSESTDEGCQTKTYFSNLSRGLLGLEVPFGKEGTGKGFVTSPADPWKSKEIKLVREICLTQFQSQAFLNFKWKCLFVPNMVYSPGSLPQQSLLASHPTACNA